MADLVNLKNKNPDLVLVFLASLRLATSHQASPRLVASCFVKDSSSCSQFIWDSCGWEIEQIVRVLWGGCARSGWLREHWTGSLGEREREREQEAWVWGAFKENGLQKKNFVNCFPFFTKGFFSQRNWFVGWPTFYNEINIRKY